MNDPPLADSVFLVLALLAEGETHGYDIQRLVSNRGFRLWTKLRRSSIYSALTLLEKEGRITARVQTGEGPDRKVYRITKRGLDQLKREGLRHLSAPSHPQSEIDLGIYALPFLPSGEARRALQSGLEHLRARKAFLKECFAWCRRWGLKLPALAFERPLLALRAEIRWLERIAREYEADAQASPDEWAKFVPPALPGSRSDEGEGPSLRRPGRGARK